MVVSGELNNGWEAGGRMAGKGFIKNVRGRLTSEIDLDMAGPHRAHNQLK